MNGTSALLERLDDDLDDKEDEQETWGCCGEVIEEDEDACEDGDCPSCCERNHETCSSCERHRTSGFLDLCDNCGNCRGSGCCVCFFCTSCEGTFDSGCYYCDNCFECCICGECDACEETTQLKDGICSNCRELNRFRLETLPWEDRGIVIENVIESTISADGADKKRVMPDLLGADTSTDEGWYSDEQKVAIEVWGVDNTIDPVQACADFYLLESIQSKVFAGPNMDKIDNDPTMDQLSAQAKDMREGLIERLDDCFVRYIDMACGGEARYHRLVQKVNQGSKNYRHAGWLTWKYIRDRVGVEAVKDCATLLADFGEGGVGGPLWAAAAEILYQRLTDPVAMPPWLFVDRVFTLQHNGGMILNKVVWEAKNPAAWDVQKILTYVGPAHASNPPQLWLLHMMSSPAVRDLFTKADELLASRCANSGVKPPRLGWLDAVDIYRATDYPFGQGQFRMTKKVRDFWVNNVMAVAPAGFFYDGMMLVEWAKHHKYTPTPSELSELRRRCGVEWSGELDAEPVVVGEDSRTRRRRRANGQFAAADETITDPFDKVAYTMTFNTTLSSTSTSTEGNF